MTVGIRKGVFRKIYEPSNDKIGVQFRISHKEELANLLKSPVLLGHWNHGSIIKCKGSYTEER